MRKFIIVPALTLALAATAGAAYASSDEGRMMGSPDQWAQTTQMKDGSSARETRGGDGVYAFGRDDRGMERHGEFFGSEREDD